MISRACNTSIFILRACITYFLLLLIADLIHQFSNGVGVPNRGIMDAYGLYHFGYTHPYASKSAIKTTLTVFITIPFSRVSYSGAQNVTVLEALMT